MSIIIKKIRLPRLQASLSMHIQHEDGILILLPFETVLQEIADA